MPLSLAKNGETAAVKRIGGSEAVKKRLETMGFTVGSEVTVVSEFAGNLIVNVRETRLALSRELANRIIV
jgi:ferrous iron transport protein A